MMNGFNRDANDHSDPDQGTIDNRSHLRTGMLVTASLWFEGEEPRQVRIRNLSEQGLMAELGHGVAMGTRLTVELPGVGEVEGQVAWSAEGRIGVALDRTIDIALVNAARSAG